MAMQLRTKVLALMVCVFGIVAVSTAPADLTGSESLLSISEGHGTEALRDDQQQSESDSEKNQGDEEEEEKEGVNTAPCWRVRSLIRSNGPRQGFEWSVTSVEFFTSSSGIGEALTGEYSSSSYKQGTQNKPQNAFDGNKDTHWQANGMDAGESIAIKLNEPKEVRSIKIRQLDEQHSVKQAVLEKSRDCVGWGRVAEFPEMSGSFEATALFKFNSVDTIPSGVFQLRSRSELNICVGVTPDSEEDEDISNGIPQKSAPIGNTLELQMCNVDVLPQFWSFNEDGNLVNAKHGLMQVELDEAGAVAADGALTLGECNGDECSELKSTFRYNDGGGDGLILHRESTHMIIVPKGGELKEGTVLTLSSCSSEGNDASIDECGDKTSAQWDVPPMFTIESGKKAVNCAPYSHNLPDKLQPTAANSRLVAQQACAADPVCNVYMWADGNTGDDANKAWLCEQLDIVYAGKQGYELGFRVKGA